MLQLSACGQAANAHSIFLISVLLFATAVVAPGVLQEGEREASTHSRTWDTLWRSLGDSAGEMPPGPLREREAAWCSPEGLMTSLMTSNQGENSVPVHLAARFNSNSLALGAVV